MEGSLAVPLTDSKEKGWFEIRTNEKIYRLKAKSDLDMKGWYIFANNFLSCYQRVRDINTQAKMVTDNKIMEELDKRIVYLEKKTAYKENDEYTKLFSEYKQFM